MRGATGPERAHFLICGFAAEGLGLKKTDIVALRTERGTVSGASLYFLRRFWLDSIEAESALPAAPARAPLFGCFCGQDWPDSVASAVQHGASSAP